ncbi:glucokinase [Bergeyella porcorum]|uniref:Glucokinase n=1 Tax=Bergeyella porcorum TaxID=1735111 RepID=A0AAU0F321_9FLAO
MTNDANAAALGEMQYGAAKGMKNFIMITLGTGVGSGIVCGGNLVYGHDGNAGELGHTIVKPGGRKHWSTGSEGSLEAYASATGIAITAKKMRAEFPDSMLNDFSEEEINSKTVHECALKVMLPPIEVFRYTGQKLGEALANFVMFSSPQAILLFGGVIKAGDFILKPAKLHMERNLLPIFRGKVQLVFSELNEADAAI